MLEVKVPGPELVELLAAYTKTLQDIWVALLSLGIQIAQCR